MLVKRQLLNHLDCLCSVSSLSACFLRTRFVMSFAKDKGLSLNATVLEPVSKQRHLRQTSEPKSPLILNGGPSIWPFCTSVQGGYSRIRCSTVCVHSTLSEDASEVLVQPLICGTEKATSVARVVVKPTPRLCIGVLATPNSLRRRRPLDTWTYPWSSFGKEDLSAPLMFQPAEYFRLKVCPSCYKWCFSPLHQVLLAPFSPDLPTWSSASSRPAGKIITSFQVSSYLLCERLRHRMSIMSSHLYCII